MQYRYPTCGAHAVEFVCREGFLRIVDRFSVSMVAKRSIKEKFASGTYQFSNWARVMDQPEAMASHTEVKNVSAMSNDNVNESPSA